jgi:D-aspartate ligase
VSVGRLIAPSEPLRAVQRRVTPAGALVLSGDWDYAGLGIVRSLGRRGIPVWVLTDVSSVAAASSYVSRTLPWPTESEHQQVAYLLELAVRHELDGWAIFPTGDSSAALLARHHAELSARFQLTTSSWEVLRWAYDKRLTYRLAAATGVPRPWTHSPANREELASLDCPFPAILKPALKPSLNRFTRAKAWRVDDRQALLARYDEACRLVPPDVIMVQELIPGNGEAQFSYAALCQDGRPLASVVARRTRQFPRDFGWTSTFVETVEQTDIEWPARRLLAAMNYSGIAEVEFKRDLRDGLYKVLDVNPRAWAWHGMAGRAGVDFPYLLWRQVSGESVPEIRARPGVRWVLLPMDFLAAVGEMRRGLLPLRVYVQSMRGPLESAVYTLEDPTPSLVQFARLTRSLFSRRQAD